MVVFSPQLDVTSTNNDFIDMGNENRQVFTNSIINRIDMVESGKSNMQSKLLTFCA